MPYGTSIRKGEWVTPLLLGLLDDCSRRLLTAA